MDARDLSRDSRRACSLGYVDGFDEDHGQSEGDNGAVVLSGLLAA
jgi:hypothetical protein